MNLELTFDEAELLVARDAEELRQSRGRRILYGIVGGPGAGKSTIAERIATILNARDARAVVVPMDGFHMRQAKLESLGLAARKGAPETFEASALAAFLVAIRGASGQLTGPGYSRKIEDVVDDAITIPAEAEIILVEGNYLLVAHEPWDAVRPALDRSVFIDVPRAIVRERLLRRHAAEGLFTAERNTRHVDSVDLPNYDVVAETKTRADIRIAIATLR
jgi:pantothenate kinase